MAIFVANESDWAVDEDALVALARHSLDQLGVDPLAELSILLVDVGAMERLHVRWMGEPGPTDVLAFPMDELDDARGREDTEPPPALLGDVVMCPEVADAQAKAAGHSLDEELHVLCAHGVLHLLGYDHAEPAEEQEMFAQQAKLVASWAAARAAGPTP